jgi:glycerol-3-phosphate dehydrogenase
MAGVDVPLALGKGTMVAMAHRAVHSTINRCHYPGDGDGLIPIGTVAIIGTTDVEVTHPGELGIEPWEIDFLLAQADLLVPGLGQARPLRAWAGIRPLYRPSGTHTTRGLPRSHTILDHEERDSLAGLISVFSGKLSTFRLMAEETVDLVAKKMQIDSVCMTRTTPLRPEERDFHVLPARLEEVRSHGEQRSALICECEFVSAAMLKDALATSPTTDLDDLRRDLRLGMGPCQAAFCALRAAEIVCEQTPSDVPQSGLHRFLTERWRGQRPLAWGTCLRQMEFTRRIYGELLGCEPMEALPE